MGFTDLLSSSFLFSIAIIIILIGAIFAYVSYRMSEQDHKISSMLGLVSTMAEEMQFFRNKISKLQEQDYDISHNQELFDPNSLLHVKSIQKNSLISVSDDENEESSSDENEESCSDENEESGSDESDEESGSVESDEDSGSDDETKLDHLKIEDIEEEEVVVDLEQNNNFLNINHVDQLDESENNIKTIHLEEIVDINESEVHIHNSLDNSFSGDLKTISIFDLEETNKKANDYKKMSLNKLREFVIEKGLVSDASKLKKNELFKLLEDE